MRDFSSWLSKMQSSINNYNYYVDFSKVYNNLDAIKVELNILNLLIGVKNIEVAFKELIIKYPEILRCIPILIAVRSNEIHAQDCDGAFDFDFTNMNYSIDQYIVFMRKTGLLNLISYFT